MNETRLLDRLARDHARLREVAALDLTARVPNCPEWTVEDLVRHLANGYVNVVVRRLRSTPADAPGEDLSGEEPLATLDRCYAMLTAQFAAQDPARQVGPDPAETVRFWIRRMAYETLIHRIDVEDALHQPTAPVPYEVAVDAIGEMLGVILVHETHAFTSDYAAHLTDWADRWLLLATDRSGWRVVVHPDGVDVSPADAPSSANATVSGEPMPLLLWLYSRPSAVRVSGDAALVDQLKAVLGAGTAIG
jgi:uncharacterized protein (TIGR03083 family)